MTKRIFPHPEMKPPIVHSPVPWPYVNTSAYIFAVEILRLSVIERNRDVAQKVGVWILPCGGKRPPFCRYVVFVALRARLHKRCQELQCFAFTQVLYTHSQGYR